MNQTSYSNLQAKFSKSIRDKIRTQVPLYQYCNYRIGGPADLFFDADTVDELIQAVEDAVRLEIPIEVIGKGTNILFRDEGYRGLIIRDNATEMERLPVNYKLEAEAETKHNIPPDNNTTDSKNKRKGSALYIKVAGGILMSRFLKEVFDENFIAQNDSQSAGEQEKSPKMTHEKKSEMAQGKSPEMVVKKNLDMIVDKSVLEPFLGLPGSVGGAVFGNAGCFGKEFGELAAAVDILDLTSGIVVRRLLTKEALPKNPEDFFSHEQSSSPHEQSSSHKILPERLASSGLHFGYRTSSLKEMNQHQNNHSTNVVILWIYLALPIIEGASKQPSDILKLRASKQPPGYSCGSFFKNPPCEKSAGRLIDESGLKGMRIGGAQISERHGNFILNIQKATAKDVIALSEKVKTQVKKKFGVGLEEEVRII